MIPTNVALFLAVCMLFCGVAMAVSKVYRYAMGFWLTVMVVFGVIGIDCEIWLCDMLLMCGGLLGIFGVTRGLVALTFNEVSQ